MKEVTLKQVGYVVTGESTLNLWGGGQGSISIKPEKVKRVSKEIILACVNDNGFGCESIDSAEIDIYDLYESGYQEFNRTIYADSQYSKSFLNWKMLRAKSIYI